jgi:hypothetical protein
MNEQKRNCPPPAELMQHLVDREGSSEAIARTRRHAEVCGDCHAVVNEMVSLGEMIRSARLAHIPLSPGFTASVMDEVYGADAGIFEDIVTISRRAIAACTACVAILLAVLVLPHDTEVNFGGMEEIIIHDDESYLFVKEEITRDDIVLFVLTEQ